ncbi:cell division protein FtsQ/DivIB [Clostridium folliculivorans]|uniref:Cell division protein DivIB n=1 Tax=Clostridium folliculivorans TaxID=2886038 RepID=A0A9W5XZM5_9CLOT|nr:FtsQ-type POTRA domain-containing protein [Clostridium folliculivorans]GKU23961.1 cell division protein DivIB [Clostridium folliculivorans]GKU30076.1 cell division protein DivIB [Clostridium folliculivorans]
MNNEINEYIKKHKRKKVRKKLVLFFIFFFSITILILLKAPFFNIADIKVENNKIIDSKDIISRSELFGKNIFYINQKDVSYKITENPYIEQVNLKRVFPNGIIINVVERKAVYFVKSSDGIYVLNHELKILEKRASIDGLNLTELTGVSPTSTDVGTYLTSDEKIKRIATNIGKLLEENKSDVKFNLANLESTTSLYMLVGDVKLLLGNDENLETKLNNCIGILKDSSKGLTKGYIDVSFNGDPVYKNE